MSRRVQIESWAWDLICDHYAGLRDPGPDDRRVIAYIADKVSRQIAHDTYMPQRRLDDMPMTED